jgi:hypothetical protein
LKGAENGNAIAPKVHSNNIHQRHSQPPKRGSGRAGAILESHRNPGTNPAANFLGTQDNQPLIIKTFNIEAIHINPGRLGPQTDGQARIPGDISVLGNLGIGTTTPGAKLHASSRGGFNSPQAEITQTTPFDFARLRFASFAADPDNPGQPRPLPLWDVAAGSGVLNVFVQTTGNVMTLTSNGRVGIHTEQPATELHVNGTATVKVLQINGGADLSEHFEVKGTAEDGSTASMPIQAGLAVSIDPDEPGKLVLSSQAYDRKVAGIISGAGGVRPGMLMSQSGLVSDGDHPLALTGRVYCWADASYGPIAPGDLLTTSDNPGHAMKVTDHAKAQGAVLGKAMTALKQGKGLVLALVTLQ